jgi:hypothetical protein
MHPKLEIPAALAGVLADAVTALVADSAKAYRLSRRKRAGATLRPGRDTALWNALATLTRPYLKKRGAQAHLARLLALDRQAIHAYFTARSRMPDAERTLQILAWVIAQRRGADAG